MLLCCLWLCGIFSPSSFLLILDFALLPRTAEEQSCDPDLATPGTPSCGHSDGFRRDQGTCRVPVTVVLWLSFAGIGGSISYFSMLQDMIWRILEIV